MATNSKIWVSELNARPEVRGAFPKTPVRFYDTTLRDGEQTVGVVLSPQQKLEIAHKLDELGVSRIEAGFPRVSAEDAEAIQLMQKAGIKAELWGFSRAVKADVDELVRLELRYCVIEAPTSAIKLKAYGISREEVLRRIRDAVSAAREAGITVAFFAVDGTRTELEFLKTVYLSALDAGAKELVVVDTIGAWARGGGISDAASLRVGWHGRARAFSRTQRFRYGDGLRGGGGPWGSNLDSGHDQWHGRTRGQRRCRRDCTRATLPLRRTGGDESRKGAGGFRGGEAGGGVHA